MKVPLFSDIRDKLNCMIQEVLMALGIDHLSGEEKEERVNALMSQKNIRI